MTGHLSRALMYANEVLSEVNAGPVPGQTNRLSVGLTYGSVNRTPLLCPWKLPVQKRIVEVNLEAVYIVVGSRSFGIRSFFIPRLYNNWNMEKQISFLA